jgi:hypothetical protein
MRIDRRRFLGGAAVGVAAALGVAGQARTTLAAVPPPQDAGARPERDPGATVILPRARVPLSFIIDDSTCLANLAYFGIPQFAEVFPDRYLQPWKSLPREIPDSFVLEFAEWCRRHGVKGKYSVVPYPACVGWVDRDLPGWSRKELEQSLAVIRNDLAADWDFHPEMVSHTWVIDTKTGRPYPERSERFMENWRWTDGKSVDELTDYLAYALRILRNAEIPCEGITTPGGFGNRVLPQLAQATLESARDVFRAEIPHYFRHLYTSYDDAPSVAPRVEYASGLDTEDPRCVVSIIGCTGDWFGGWDGLTPGSVDPFITEDLRGGRLPEVIARGEPAVLVCHWPGIYYNGTKLGLRIFQEIVRRLEAGFDNLRWMKLSEISRYWAARELTAIERTATGWGFSAPFAAPDFTVEFDAPEGPPLPPAIVAGADRRELRAVERRLDLTSDTWCRDGAKIVVCFDLAKGRSALVL